MNALAAPHPALTELVRRARDLGHYPVAYLSLIEGSVERLHVRLGLDADTLPAEGAYPFMAAAPLVTADGRSLGRLAVADIEPRESTREQRTALANLASLAVARLEAAREAQLPRGGMSPVERLEEEEAFARALLESFRGAVFLASADGRVVRWNSVLPQTLGLADARIPGMRPVDFISERDQPLMRAAFQDVLGGKAVAMELEVVDAAGNVCPYDFNARPVALASGQYVLGIVRDITLRKRAEQQMVRAKERLDLALTSSSLALWDWDFALERVYFNESWARLLGDEARESTYSEEHLLKLAHPDDRGVLKAAVGNAAKGVSEAFDVEFRVPAPEGGWIWIHARGKVTQRDGPRALRMTGTCTDITKRKAAEERAEYLATRDALTGLPNRVLLHDRLEQGVANAARNATGFAFMFIDLDRFKTINDSLGHHVGDELLKNVAARLSSCVRATDTVARLGGDEFAVILENLRDDDEEGAQEVAEKMISAMAAPLLIEGQPLNTSCSIGISLYPADGRDSATLMKNADVAMYFAKEKGRNNYQFFSREMNARAQERLSIENYLRLALRRNELVVHYQPRMRVDTGELVAVEALIRWQHPRRGLLTPDKFIEVAEDSGLIVPIGEWVLGTACRQLKAWQSTIREGLRISVNLSVGQVGDAERLFRAVAGALEGAGLPAELLELELTESHLMRDVAEKVTILDRLGELGVGLSIDDFGTGYSSLSYLKRLPVDSIKIDGSFVRDIGQDPNDEAIIHAILAMAHSLKLSVVAEGVETPAQLEALRGLGCDEYQGFIESPGLAAAEFEKRYRRA